MWGEITTRSRSRAYLDEWGWPWVYEAQKPASNIKQKFIRTFSNSILHVYSI